MRHSTSAQSSSRTIAIEVNLCLCPQVQQDFVFYSSSILIIYEGDAQQQSETDVAIRLVDFAHTFPVSGQRDTNFCDGLASFMAALEGAVAVDTQDDCSL